MYPYVRMVKELVANRSAPRLQIGEFHVSRHICWPWDLDVWFELNNGRTLTLFDLGRAVLFLRSGFLSKGRAQGWTGSVAGASVRYRRRIRMFNRIEMRTRMIGWDRRFFYCEQSLWRGDTCCSHALLRLAVTDKTGIVAPELVAGVLDYPTKSPPLPEWVEAWGGAEEQRPWPPMAA